MALEVLRRTGIRFHHQEALEMLKEAGAFVSDDNQVPSAIGGRCSGFTSKPDHHVRPGWRAGGVPGRDQGLLWHWFGMLERTTKPIVFVTNDRASCQRAIDMAAAVVGGYEVLAEQQHILLYSEPSSPLQRHKSATPRPNSN